MPKIDLTAEMSFELLKPFLQYLRDFDRTFKGCTFSIHVDVGAHSKDEVLEVLQSIKPPFASLAVNYLEKGSGA